MVDMESREIARRLKENSEEVSRALDDFMAERRLALSKQEQAIFQYDAELKEIDESPLGEEYRFKS